MALLDFIKNRGAQQPAPEQQTQQSSPENAKQMYTREAAEQKASAKPLALNAKDNAATKDAGDLFRQGTQSNEQAVSSPTPATTDSNTAPQQPMVQPSMNQDKDAPALSPTSAQAAGRESEQGVSVSEASSPSQTPSPARGQNHSSWDR